MNRKLITSFGYGFAIAYILIFSVFLYYRVLCPGGCPFYYNLIYVFGPLLSAIPIGLLFGFIIYMIRKERKVITYFGYGFAIAYILSFLVSLYYRVPCLGGCSFNYYLSMYVFEPLLVAIPLGLLIGLIIYLIRRKRKKISVDAPK